MSEDQSPYTFAWSPPAYGYFGAIMLHRKPSERLTRDTYQLALAARINRLVADEDESDVREILRPLERNEPWMNIAPIATLGERLVENSDWLHTHVSFPLGGIPASELEHEPETLEWLLSGDDSLEGFVANLYPEPDWG